MRRFYSALFRAGVNAEILRPSDDLSPYRVVIAPHLYVLPDAVADALAGFVRGGGVLLTDCRTGVKDATGLCHDRTLPGRLSRALGIAIEEYEAFAPEIEYGVTGRGAVEGDFTAIHYADWLTPRGAEVLAGYTPWHMKDFAAATRHRFGKGWGYYVGAIVKEPAFYDQVVAAALASAGVRPILSPPPGVEVSVRQGRGRKLLFVVNHTEAVQALPVPKGKRELLSGRTTTAMLELGPYDVAVVKLK